MFKFTDYRYQISENGYIEGAELDRFFRDLVGILDKKDVHVSSKVLCGSSKVLCGSSKDLGLTRGIRSGLKSK